VTTVRKGFHVEAGMGGEFVRRQWGGRGRRKREGKGRWEVVGGGGRGVWGKEKA